MRFSLLPIPLLLAAALFAHADEVPGGHPAPRDDAKDSIAVVTGSGANTFKTVPQWGNVPDKLKIGPTHGGIVVDKKGLIYVSSDSAQGIYVFQPDGTLAKNIAAEFSGIHGLCIREEKGEEFLYAAHLRGAQALKLKLDGTAVLKIPFPEEAAASYPNGVKDYKPTAIAVAPNGDIFVSDGYGKSLIHKFDAAGKYLKSFGGKGTGDGQFQTSHGLLVDTRFEKPLLLVCDRENRRLVHLDLDGNFVGVITTGLRRPCSASIHGDNIAIAELEARVAIIDKTNQVVAVLGDNPDKSQWAKFDIAPDWWKPGIFTAPHGVSYDAAGNLYVQDWNKTGRVTKLVKAAPTRRSRARSPASFTVSQSPPAVTAPAFPRSGSAAALPTRRITTAAIRPSSPHTSHTSSGSMARSRNPSCGPRMLAPFQESPSTPM